MILDNAAINRIAVEKLRIQNPTFSEANQVISGVMASMTAPIRFPGFMDCTLTNLVAATVPFSPYHYIIPGYVPSVNEFGQTMTEVHPPFHWNLS